MPTGSGAAAAGVRREWRSPGRRQPAGEHVLAVERGQQEIGGLVGQRVVVEAVEHDPRQDIIHANRGTRRSHRAIYATKLGWPIRNPLSTTALAGSSIRVRTGFTVRLHRLAVRMRARAAVCGHSRIRVGVAKRRECGQRYSASVRGRPYPRAAVPGEFQRAEARVARDDAPRPSVTGSGRAAVDERERRKASRRGPQGQRLATAGRCPCRVSPSSGRAAQGRGIPRPSGRTFCRPKTHWHRTRVRRGPLGRPGPPPLRENFVAEVPSGLGKGFGGAGRFAAAARQRRADHAEAVERYRAARLVEQELAERSAPPTTRTPPSSPPRSPSRSTSTSSSGTAGPGAVGGREVRTPSWTGPISGGVPVPDRPCTGQTRGSRHRVGSAAAIGDPARPGRLYATTRDAIDALPRAEKEIRGALPHGDRASGARTIDETSSPRRAM